MIITKEIHTEAQLLDLLFDQSYNEQVKRLRSAYFYRGIPDTSYKMLTSLARNCKDVSRALEKPLLDNFIKYVRIEDPTINESVWKAMIVGQHHGLPTRLLDWTHSPLVALHFANTEACLDDLDRRDCMVWRIDARELNGLLPQRYRDALSAKKTFVFSIEHLNEVVDSVERYDRDMEEGHPGIAFLEPPSLDERIVNQYSFFQIIPHCIPDLEAYLDAETHKTVRYIIDRSLRWNIRDLLDQFNINERIIYPGIDGIAKWLARHYYKR